MPCFFLFFLLFLCFTTSSAVVTSNVDYFIACGIPNPSMRDGVKVWQSDDNPTASFAPQNLTKVSSAVANSRETKAPFTAARIFKSSVTYSFPVSPGPKFLRLYFTTTTSYIYNNTTIDASDLFISVEVNGFTLLQNFSAFLNSQNSQSMFYEYHLAVENDKPLRLTFSPPSTCPTTIDCIGFINGFEIMAVPDGLYFNSTRIPPPFYVNTEDGSGYSSQQDMIALQTIYRINVGGSAVQPVEDSGGLSRSWKADIDYLVKDVIGTTVYPPTAVGEPGWSAVKYRPEVPSYVAPKHVYGTLRYIGLNSSQSLGKNLTWKFDVDPGFDYLVRLHFCELDNRVTGSQQRVFQVYINNQTAGGAVDVWDISGGTGFAVFRDYVFSFYGQSAGIKVPLWLALHPTNDSSNNGYIFYDVLLNGLEILKLNQVNGNNLAVPNPPSAAPLHNQSPSQAQSRTTNHRILPFIAGAIGFVAVFLFACLLVYKRKKKMLKRETMTTETSSTDKWAPLPHDLGSKTSSMSSSLPSDLCRRFSFIQIRIATSDFDESLIIGKGGFGNVYKGSIDGGATTVAIKRLNSTSKQGLNEFQTEIEMLSRLRHVHLVSLIGYCDEQHEMILVYEYMPRGTLRDHLMYKNPQNNNKSPPLSWKQRLQICVGSARGLHYLHAGAKHLIIHRDIKSTNILLDAKWTAKVSDFGLSKVGPDPNPGGSGSTYVSTAVKGSAGYLDPEYCQRHQLTEKSDVYSFGVVLFEVLCARAAVNPNLPKEQANLAMWARSRYKSGVLHTIVDPNLTGQIAPESLRKFGEIADMCVRDRGSERPSMGDVAWGLEFTLQLQETAEKNNISGGGSAEEIILDPTSNNSFSIVATDIINIDEFTTSRDNFYSQSSSVGDGASKRLLDSRSTTSISSDYPVDMKSGSVFSEIIDPKAR